MKSADKHIAAVYRPIRANLLALGSQSRLSACKKCFIVLRKYGKALYSEKTFNQLDLL